MLRVLSEQADLFGNRLKDLHTSGLLDTKSGQLNWKFGVYTLQFEDKRLAIIIHISGVRAAIPEEFKYSKAGVQLKCNWSDAEAVLVQTPYPDKLVCTLFGPEQAPDALQSLVTGNKQHGQLLSALAKKHSDAHAQ